MDFNFTQEQTLLEDSLRRYLARSYALPARRKAIAAVIGYDVEHWQAYADMGVLALNVPEAHGGLAAGPGGNPLDTLVVMRELGRALVVEPLWMSAVVCANAIALGGTDAQQAKLLPELADGSKVFALAALEPGGRYDANHVAATATATAGGFTLAGRKAVVLHGAQADHLIVSARVAGSITDAEGIALFIVDRTTPGLRALDSATVDGLRAAEITLDGVVVPQSALLAGGTGGNTGGAAVLERTIQLAGAALCAEALGIVEALIEATNEYLKTRKQFGVPIGKFQALQHRIADMLVCVEQVRAMAYFAAVKVGLEDAGARRSAIAAARATIAEAGRFVGKHAVQLHGGMGVTDELAVSHYVKRLTMLNQTFGDYEHHLAQYAEGMAA
ncbi:MAG: acyl-CoA dehydrogenase family protein [Betaproteobacteria bacterium]|nr:acyl-CoA dehydrogenase family protein [Betaproteobacteria bacterium]